MYGGSITFAVLQLLIKYMENKSAWRQNYDTDTKNIHSEP